VLVRSCGFSGVVVFVVCVVAVVFAAVVATVRVADGQLIVVATALVCPAIVVVAGLLSLIDEATAVRVAATAV